MISFLFIGALSGFFAGLLGLGGGVIIVPALAIAFAAKPAIPPTAVMQLAIGTSLATIIVTYLASFIEHLRRQSVRWDIVKRLLPGLASGVVIGSIAAGWVPSAALEKIFGCFLLFVVYRLLRHTAPPAAGVILPNKASLLITGLLIGMCSGILGVGGGLLLIPFLVRCGLDMRQATGTSVACGVVIGLVASMCFMQLTPASPPLPWQTGFIYWPAFGGIALTSVVFAPLGAKVAYRLPVSVLRRILAAFLLLNALKMVLSS